jgi:hypothetical protein
VSSAFGVVRCSVLGHPEFEIYSIQERKVPLLTERVTVTRNFAHESAQKMTDRKEICSVRALTSDVPTVYRMTDL